MSSAAAIPAADGAVPIAPHSGAAPTTWVERHIARRDAARVFLASRCMPAKREQHDHHDALPQWRVTGWTTLFGDHDLIALAQRYGWQADV